MAKFRNDKIDPEEYLNKSFDYMNLTKQRLYEIMQENKVKRLPNILQTKKEKLQNLYKTNIHDRIDEIISLRKNDMENVNTKKDDLTNSNNTNGSNATYVSSNDTYDSRNNESINRNNASSINESTNSYDASGVNVSDKQNGIHKDMKIKFIIEKNKIDQEKEPQEDESHSETMANVSIHSMDGEKEYVRLKKISIIKSEAEQTNQERNDGVKTDLHYNEQTKKILPTLKLKHNDKKYHSSSFTEKSFNTPEKRIRHKSLPIIKNNDNVFVKHTKRKTNIKTIVCGVIFVTFALFVYFKYFCCYCKNDEFFCVKLPKKAKFVNNEIVCEKGYLFKKRMIFPNSCVIDKSKEKIKDFCAKKMVELLREKNTKMVYGFEKSNRMSIEEFLKIFIAKYYEEARKRSKNVKESKAINTNSMKEEHDVNTKDAVNNAKDIIDSTKYENIETYSNNNVFDNNFDAFIKNVQKKYDDIVYENGYVFSNKVNANLQVFVRYYFFPLFLYSVLTFTFLFFIFVIQKFYRENRNRKIEYEFVKNKIVQDIKEALISQKTSSTKNNMMQTFILVNQLKDYFCCDCKLWKDVCNDVRKNTNIREYVVFENEMHYCVWEWIGPIISKKYE